MGTTTDDRRLKELVFLLKEDIQNLASSFKNRTINIMEVCGTHTVSIFRSGIRSLLPANIRLISGPGCPVCVTAQEDINALISLSDKEDLIIATYGDMLKVPGDNSSLYEQRAKGKDIRIITSVVSVLKIAVDNPKKKVVFFAVGFETTAPMTAWLLKEALNSGIKNLFVFCAHKRVVPALFALLDDPDINIDGFLLPGHVSVVIGRSAYEEITKRYKVACCIAGFEPVDIMLGIKDILLQIKEGDFKIGLSYSRAVTEEGNLKAQKLLSEVFTVSDANWRGLGIIPDSGFALKEPYLDFDVIKAFGLNVNYDAKRLNSSGCRCGDVLKGIISPVDCPLFGVVCNPLTPYGPCMVSSEGSCSAYYKYGRR